MNGSRVVSVRRSALTPEIPAGAHGVSLVLAPRTGLASPVVLHGAYSLPWSDADKIAPSRHRAIVLVVTTGPRHLVATPFRDLLLFEDDERAAREGVKGAFSIDLTALSADPIPDDFQAFVSIGPHVSNVLVVEASPAAH